jgi:methionine sulfoxide reductase heme-binding subunit
MSIKRLKIATFLLCLGPVLTLAWRAAHGGLGANPVEFVTHSTGDWTLRFLLITLAVTPVRSLTGLLSLIRFRRMLGLFAFFYGCVHLLTYVWFDKFFNFPEMFKDVAKRPFITIGFASLLSMVPLAVTSTAGWIRRLGGKRWQRLHRLVYLIAAGGVIHYYWLVKSDIRLPVLYGAILGVLLAYRWFALFAKRRTSHVPVLPHPQQRFDQVSSIASATGRARQPIGGDN